MANPVVVATPADAWTKVAENVTAGTIHKLSVSPSNYLQTYRLTGEAAPTDVTEGALAFEHSHSEPIESVDPIDVYIYAKDKAGSVRADL